MRRRLLLGVPMSLACSGLGGCSLLRRRRRPPPAPAPVVHAVVGRPYRSSGMWHYPRARLEYDETGLAVLARPRGPYAVDGAPWDAGALQGAHATLQLPCVVRVTNLESGRQIRLRLDDRGPDGAGRLLGLTPRAAALLGGGSEPGLWRVRVEVDDGLSRALAAQFGDPDAPTLAIAIAPAGEVRTESLGPPGATGRSAARSPAGAAMTPAAPGSPVASVPLRLPETVLLTAVGPTQLWVDAGGFGRVEAARRLQGRLATLGAMIVRDAGARPEVAYRVRVGPFASSAGADRALDQVLRAGVAEAGIVVA